MPQKKGPRSGPWTQISIRLHHQPEREVVLAASDVVHRRIGVVPTAIGAVLEDCVNMQGWLSHTLLTPTAVLSDSVNWYLRLGVADRTARRSYCRPCRPDRRSGPSYRSGRWRPSTWSMKLTR